ncbi:MAG: glycoside hydrolase family 3 C-terminal domain-containing protein [Pseudomonadales bacterium]|nr:glycoside hydrolase family 3 C-terminal domain-containing protein [Pseudomonadales bacterium]MCP5190271.1 glycoside hydrolase family 3 C-terminal domain-containing protein [Pseudomonadales bacterium]
MTDEPDLPSLVASLNTEEKAALCSGRDFWFLNSVERLDLPAIMLTDGPHGLRKQTGASDHVGLADSVPATCFPSPASLASTWNRELLAEVGRALGEECRKEGVSVLLGPGANLKRNPLGGRNFEYFSEDPYLSGEMAAAWIQGLQSQGVGASLKHFAVNNHETGRMVVDAVVDERTLRELYLPAFESAVRKAQPWTVMCAYNKVNGSYLAEHRQLLTQILREEWGFEGLVVSDWGAVSDRVEGLKNGLDLEMPSSGGVNTRRILDALADGSLSMAGLDAAVTRVLALILKARESLRTTVECSLDAHHELARAAAEEACVLLKNDGGLLPLTATGSLAVIGALAERTRYQGSGSSQINPTRLEQPLEEIRALVGEAGTVNYAPGYALDGRADAALVEQAVSLAASSDRVILILGLPPAYESEGFDRDHMDLPGNQVALVEALVAFHDRVVIVLQNGAPVTLPFAGSVPAILEAYLGGQAGASALANILFGRANPGGKLAESFPTRLEDVPNRSWFPGELRRAQYREGPWVGYRYFDTAGVPVAFPFGHGLSYTRFEYSGLRVSGRQGEPGAGFGMADGDTVTVEFTLTNTGSCSGAEIAQVYVGQRAASVPRPARELKGFDKVLLDAGESRTIRVSLDHRAFAFWCIRRKRWVVECDAYEISVGASVADIRLRSTVNLSTDSPVATRDPELAAYFDPGALGFDATAFEGLLGRPIPRPVPTRPYHFNSTLGEVADTWLGRQLQKLMLRQVSGMMGEEQDENGRRMIVTIISEMPLRNLVTMSQGKLRPGLMRAMIHIMNGDWIKLLFNVPVSYR